MWWLFWKHTSKKEIVSKRENNNCCDRGSQSKTKNNEGCGGKCGSSKCACPSFINAFTVSSEFNLKNIILNFSFKKEKYFNATTGAIMVNMDLPDMNHNTIYSPNGNEIWLPQMGMNGKVLVYNASTYALMNTITVGMMLAELTFSSDGTKA